MSGMSVTDRINRYVKSTINTSLMKIDAYKKSQICQKSNWQNLLIFLQFTPSKDIKPLEPFLGRISSRKLGEITINHLW